MSKNVACAWGLLFEPFARAYLEWEHNTKVFGHTTSLNLAKDHPLYGKVTCSPDGYFEARDKTIVLLEFKCPYKRKIVVNKIPLQYSDQIQTGLALSGESVTKVLFVDAYFRMCNIGQLGKNLEHNAAPNGGVVHKTKTPFSRAWSICILESKHKIHPNQTTLFNLGTTKIKDLFGWVMCGIAAGTIKVSYRSVRVVFTPAAKNQELNVLRSAKAGFRAMVWGQGLHYPVAFFAWKLLDITEIEEPKKPNFLEAIQPSINTFHKNLEREKTRQSTPVKTIPNTFKDDSAMLESFLRDQLELIEKTPPLCTQQWRKQIQHQ